jgi:hypothetical protein
MKKSCKLADVSAKLDAIIPLFGASETVLLMIEMLTDEIANGGNATIIDMERSHALSVLLRESMRIIGNQLSKIHSECYEPCDHYKEEV